MQDHPGKYRVLPREGVTRIDTCHLRARSIGWPYSDAHAEAIEAQWQEARKLNPRYFNGIVYLMDDVHIESGTLTASFLRSDFKSYLHWRRSEFPEAGVFDGFGTAFIRSSDGYVMLGLQRSGNVNSGRTYMPAGFVDENDVKPDGSIDITASVVREVREETGIDDNLLVKDPGLFVVRYGPHIAIAVPLHLTMTAKEFVAFVEQHNAVSEDPELEAIVPVRAMSDIEGMHVVPFTRVLLEYVFAAR
jgi:8-oxo-dGTP pyrophosphatase MutT (NUDIX family)